jgi:thioredoxin-related protein
MCLSFVALAADSATIPVARDLQADGHTSRQLRIPIMLLVTRKDCGYCKLLKRAVVRPMLISGEYIDRVLIREVIVDGESDLVDFDGTTVSPFAVANRYDALLTPTVVLVGRDGRVLVDKIIGISNEDMYLWYLDNALADATRSLRRD